MFSDIIDLGDDNMPFLIPFLFIFALVIGGSVCAAIVKANNKSKSEQDNVVSNKKYEVEEYNAECENEQGKTSELNSEKHENIKEEAKKEVKKTKKKHKRKVFTRDVKDETEDTDLDVKKSEM